VKHCAVCDRDLDAKAWSTHIVGRPHRRQLQFTNVEAAIKDASKNKHGISVDDGPLDYGIIDFRQIGQKVQKVISIQNAVPFSRVKLVRCRLSSQINGSRVSG
jgi:helicase MOV-10